jgi:hypothetical protein
MSPPLTIAAGAGFVAYGICLIRFVPGIWRWQGRMGNRLVNWLSRTKRFGEIAQQVREAQRPFATWNRYMATIHRAMAYSAGATFAGLGFMAIGVGVYRLIG